MYRIVVLILAGINSCTMLYVHHANKTIARVGGKEYDVAQLARVDEGDIPEECRDKTYCTIKPKNYPDEYIKSLYKEGCIDPTPTLSRRSQFSSVGRSGVDSDGFHDDCPANVTYGNIYSIRKEGSEGWRKVVAIAEQNQQKVRITECADTNQQCFTGAGFASDVKTVCLQEFSDWEFVVMGPDGTLGAMSTYIPVCCSCFYKIGLPIDFK